MRYYEFSCLNEAATGGSTSAGNVASISKPIVKEPKTIGTNFDSDGDKGIYQNKKPILLRRTAVKEHLR